MCSCIVGIGQSEDRLTDRLSTVYIQNTFARFHVSYGSQVGQQQ